MLYICYMKKLLTLIVIFVCINSYAQTAQDYFNQGNAKNLKDDYLGAEKDYTKAIELNPKYIDAYINRGRLRHNGFHDDKSAIADYDAVIAIDPKHADAYFYRGNAYRNLRNFQQACTDWYKAAELGNKDATKRIYDFCSQ